jgi:hypothetical protein
MGVEEIGSPIFHDHWVTALTALKPASGLPSLLVHVRNSLSLWRVNYLILFVFCRGVL